MSMKILLAKVDAAGLETLRTALTINRKMGNRLAVIIKLRKEEETNGDTPLSELLNSISD